MLRFLNTKQSPIISILTILITAAIVMVIVLLLASCAPSEAQIQAAIAKTETARPTVTFTLIPSTETKTNTPTATITNTPVPISDCAKEKVIAASQKISDIYSEFTDAMNVAQSTSRIALSGPISDMQAAKRKADLLEVPACMKAAKSLFVDGMENMIEGFIAFMGQESDDVVSGHFSDAGDKFKSATKEIVRIRSCLPNCQ